jgi:hypothetical protein
VVICISEPTLVSFLKKAAHQKNCGNLCFSPVWMHVWVHWVCETVWFMCECVRECECVWVHVWVCERVWGHVWVCESVWVHVWMCECIWVYKRLSTCICEWMCESEHVWVSVYVCVCLCLHKPEDNLS